MEKNTAWAIGLSTAVFVGFFAAQMIFFPQKNAAPAQSNQAAEEKKAEAAVENTSPADGLFSAEEMPSLSQAQLSEGEAVLEKNETLLSEEQQFVIETNVVKAVFTNRGGDIISYELKNHKDHDTGKGVEMVANVTSSNRAFGISLGASDNLVNDVFEAKKIDERTIGFFKNFTVKNSDGSVGAFTLVKTYAFKDDEYLFKLDVTVDGGERFSGIDVGGNAYSLRTAPEIGTVFNPKDRYDVREVVAYDGNKKFTPKAGKERAFEWIAVAGKYFEILVNPAESVPISGNVKAIVPDRKGNVKNSQVTMTRTAFSENRISDSYYVYIGPRSEKEIKKYVLADKNAWGVSGTHYNESLPTSGILSWLEFILKSIMELIYKVIPNWGVSIIILTIILKMALFPLTKKSLEGTQKMSAMQPRMKEIQEKYRDDPQRMQQESAKLYKEIGYNPMSGCLPLIFQFVILWSMYHLFNNYFEFRGASFIRGWIDDLSSTDKVATLGFSIPWLGNELHILPIIYLISQLLYGKITQNGGTAAGQSNGQMKLMMYGMPILFFFIFYTAPSGLLLYWTVSNIFQLAQQLVINRMMKRKGVAASKNQKSIRVKSKRK